MKTVWVFDVDGVITNPREKKVTEPEILDHIIHSLEKGIPVALNSGRALSWMADRVVNLIINKLKDKKYLQNFFVSGEKGGTWIIFDEKGEMKNSRDESISIPQSLKKRVNDLVTSEFSDCMFDNNQDTMIGLEMKDGYSLDDFKKKQEILVPKLKKLIEEEGLINDVQVIPSTIGTDINKKIAGKGFAMERILRWLKEKQIEPNKFIAFGDSKQDIGMAQKLYEKGHQVEFVFVGGKDKLSTDFPFKIIITQNLFGKGTVEALKNYEFGV